MSDAEIVVLVVLSLSVFLAASLTSAARAPQRWSWIRDSRQWAKLTLCLMSALLLAIIVLVGIGGHGGACRALLVALIAVGIVGLRLWATTRDRS